MSPARVGISVVVLTLDEAANLGACLESVEHWTAASFVVDSGSRDDTVAIAVRHGATVVTHPFETHARQWHWALETLPIMTEWVLALDADQRVTTELRDELIAMFQAEGPVDLDGLFINRRQIFRGRWIRHGGYYPKYLLKLFRRSRVALDESDLVDHHFIVSGRVGTLRHDLVEDNRNEAAIANWTAKHNRYAVLQAKQEELAGSRGVEVTARALLGHHDERTMWVKQQWRRLPLVVRPCLYVFYRYIVRLGFLDGRQGFIFHVLQGFWYRLLVDINIQELRERTGRSAEAPAKPGGLVPRDVKELPKP